MSFATGFSPPVSCSWSFSTPSSSSSSSASSPADNNNRTHFRYIHIRITENDYMNYLKSIWNYIPCDLCHENVRPLKYDMHMFKEHDYDPWVACCWCLEDISSLQEEEEASEHLLKCAKEYINTPHSVLPVSPYMRPSRHKTDMWIYVRGKKMYFKQDNRLLHLNPKDWEDLQKKWGNWIRASTIFLKQQANNTLIRWKLLPTGEEQMFVYFCPKPVEEEEDSTSFSSSSGYGSSTSGRISSDDDDDEMGRHVENEEALSEYMEREMEKIHI